MSRTAALHHEKIRRGWDIDLRNANVARKKFHVGLIENFLGESHPFFFMHAVVVGHDARSVLSPMLEMDYTVVEFCRDRFMRIYTSYTAHNKFSKCLGVKVFG